MGKDDFSEVSTISKSMATKDKRTGKKGSDEEQVCQSEGEEEGEGQTGQRTRSKEGINLPLQAATTTD